MTNKPTKNPTQLDASQPLVPDDSPAYVLAERAVWYLMEKKGDKLTIIDLRGRSDVCDFFVICTGYSKTQVNALAKHAHNMLVGMGHKPKGLEGMNEGRWALLDFFDVVLHIFKSDAREYFQLERLWGDAPRLDLTPEFFAAEAVQARHPGVNFATAVEPDENN